MAAAISASRKRRAFTLLEVMVALVLAGILTAGVALVLRTGLDASSRMRERSDTHAEARAALEALSGDITAAYLSGANTTATLFEAKPAEAVQPGQPILSLTTCSYRHFAGGAAAPRSDAVRVDYFLEPMPQPQDAEPADQPQPANSNDPEAARFIPPSRLVRQERWLTETGEGIREVVCERVVGLKLKFDASSEEQGDGEWSASSETDLPLTVYEDEERPTTSSRTLPRSVEVTLFVQPGGSGNSHKPPRVYRTKVLVGPDGTPPFETETVPRPQPSGGNSGNSDSGNRGNGNAGNPGGGRG